MKKLLLAFAVSWLAFAPTANAANVNIDGLPAASSATGTDLLECEQSGVNNKCTAAQEAAYVYGLMSGDATASGTGAVTFKTVNANVGSFGSATQCTAVTVNAKGLITAISATTCTPAVGSVTGLATGIATFLTTPSSANLLAALTTKTGTGNAVFGSAPTIDSLNATTAATLAFITGSTQCLQVNTSGAISGTGAACGGSGSTGANPTATAGATAVNGSATTFMRSDGAPAVQVGSASQQGILQVDGTTIKAAAGVISAPPQATSRTVTGSTDTILSTDLGNIIYYNSASSIAVSQPAPSGSFAAGFFVTLCSINSGLVTVTPGSGNIGGASTFPLPIVGTASNPACASYQSDGTNFNLVPSYNLNASIFTAGTVAAARGGAGTINGALKSNGSGVVSQAACADLSNGATGCSAATGTSGATLPLLNGNNTFSGNNSHSGTETFTSVVGAINTQTGTTYTLAATDCGKTVLITNASAITLTTLNSIPAGCSIAVEQGGAGQITVSNGSGATLTSTHSYTKTFNAAGAIIGLFVDTNTGTNAHFVLTGDGA